MGCLNAGIIYSYNTTFHQIGGIFKILNCKEKTNQELIQNCENIEIGKKVNPL